MALFIPGTANVKRRRAAMQAALYHARKHRIERASGGAPVSSQWNPADLTHITLSNGGLTANGTATAGGVRGLIGHNSGKRMLSFSILCDTGDLASLDFFGVGPLDNPIGDVNGGAPEVIMLPNFNVYSEGSLGGSGGGGNWPGGFSAAHPAVRLDLVIDFVNGKAFYRYNGLDWNASATANPTTNVGGYTISAGTLAKTLYPYIRLAEAGSHVTLNTQPDNIPSGVVAWG